MKQLEQAKRRGGIEAGQQEWQLQHHVESFHWRARHLSAVRRSWKQTLKRLSRPLKLMQRPSLSIRSVRIS
jgi:hypothetical protein